ncbi:MAG: FHA domain-containing protein [Planctomycetales bacterium]
MPALIIQSGKHRGQKLTLPAGTIVVGRDEECQIRLASSDVSRRHCALRTGPKGFVVQDLGSSNGTFVNNIPVQQELRLTTGDLLRIGPVEFRIADVEPALADREAPAEEWATDDDIATWLGAEGAEGPESGETTIVKDDAPPAAASAERTPPERTPPPPTRSAKPPHVALGPRPRFASLAEEAADIIRRYKDQTGGSARPEQSSGSQG